MRTFLLLLAVMTCVLCAPAFAATLIFSEDFESYTAGNELVSNDKWGSVTSDPASNTFLTVTQDTGAIFNHGTSNKYLRAADLSNTALTRMDAKPSSTFQLATLSLDFYEKGGVTGTYWSIGIAGATSIDFNGGQIRVNSGTYTTVYTADALHHLDIILNNTTVGEAYDVNSIANSVASGTFDLWIDGVLILDNFALTGATPVGNDLTKFAFNTSSGSYSQEMWIDNITLYSGIAVPEPSTAGLLLMTLVAAAGCRRRQLVA